MGGSEHPARRKQLVLFPPMESHLLPHLVRVGERGNCERTEIEENRKQGEGARGYYVGSNFLVNIFWRNDI